jgi:hypothetical protein
VEILDATLANNKHPTFQLNPIIRKVGRVLLHDTILTFLYLWDRLSKKVLATTRTVGGGVLQQRKKVSHGKYFLFPCPTENYFTKKQCPVTKFPSSS